LPTKIFVNLAVADLERSRRFFEKLGFDFNPQLTDHRAACMVISDDIFAMLLTRETFREFTTREIADATRTTEVLTCLSAESRPEVDRLVDAALAAGVSEARPPQDHGFMYGRSFHDIDGHVREIMWMDPAAIPPS
jgi:hypothetical protein